VGFGVDDHLIRELMRFTKIDKHGTHVSGCLNGKEEPYEDQKFWSPIRCSDVGCNPRKLRGSGPVSEVLVFVATVRVELDLCILDSSQSNRYPKLLSWTASCSIEV
jgi:hypothetical protein